MGSIHELLKDVPIPRLVPVRQIFDATHLEDVAAEVRRELSRPEVVSVIEPNMSIAITAGSRGIHPGGGFFPEGARGQALCDSRHGKPRRRHGPGPTGCYPWLWRYGGERGLSCGGHHGGKKDRRA